MQITKHIDYYWDGGSLGICTDQGFFCIDRRVHTKTKNVLYLGYPDIDGNRQPYPGTIVTDPTIKQELINALSKEWDGFNTEIDTALQILRNNP
jgi:hypothetical protein